ncbi:MAG TPA: glycosyltransferase [Thermomicrobiaceae bacterium]|nr:glycosyltransferase [Thermomicrobiaceae bacterium]
MRIAIVGTRGIPAGYSGFETCAEELGTRLVARGHEVTVYCRSHHVTYPETTYRGVNLVKLPTIRNKYLDTLVHTALSCLHLIFGRHDLVLMFIVGNAPTILIPRLFGLPVVLNVDGLDWQRDKWPRPAKHYLQWCERLAGRLANTVVTDARVVQEYYRQRYGRKTRLIAYGAEPRPGSPDGTLQRFGLRPRDYVLYVGRLVPENCAHDLVEAFERLDTDMRCVIVGDAPYATEYQRQLRARASDRILFTGYVFGQGYWELINNAYAYVFPPQVGGTHPALIEAMAAGNCVIVRDTPANLEVVGDAALPFSGQRPTESLAERLRQVIDDPHLVEHYAGRARNRIAARYSWETVTDEYEALFRSLLDG